MASFCFVHGLRVMFGHSVSKSNIKTKRRFNPNMRYKSFHSAVLDKSIRLKVSNKGIRTIYKHGSLDNYVLTTGALKLTEPAIKFKKILKKKMLKQSEKEVKASAAAE